VQSVVSITYTDLDGATQTMDPGQYVLDVVSRPVRILRAYNALWPEVRCEGTAEPVAITYVAGYADQSAVPANIKHAIKLLVGHWFEHPEEVSIAGWPSTLPMASRALLDSAYHGEYP
jgi:uncharacterized phiE125 gp8 family phage protein